ncbi:MAG TPA: CHAD domain-containing protein [Phycisphaerae bacterium]|jgi:CHAD domain-containing protein
MSEINESFAEEAREPAPAMMQAPKASLLAAAQKRHHELAELLTKGTAALGDSDFVHDLRVATRRMGEVARLLNETGATLDKPTAKAIATSLRLLRQAMGNLRDSDVTREHLLKWRIPMPLKKVAQRIAGALEENRPTLQVAAQMQMQTASLAGTMVILARSLEDIAQPEQAAEAERGFRAALEDLIKTREKQLKRSFGVAAKKQTAASLHAARICVKKMRYVLELAVAAGGGVARRGIKSKVRQLKQLQELLGDHHDAHVITEQLEVQLKGMARPWPKSLSPAWRKWQRHTAGVQSKRAAVFFAKTYAWMNG